MSKRVLKRLTAVVAAIAISFTAAIISPDTSIEAKASPVIANGIDVSHYQGVINWTAVAASGISFAFVRVGTSNTIDTQYINNLTGAAAAGLRVGVYWYTYAMSAEQAASEANLLLQLIAPYQVSFPVVIDIEAQCQKALTMAQQQEIVNTFCTIVSNAGYMPMVYASRNWYVQRLGDVSWQKWVAQYSDTNTMPYSYGVWQYTSSGSVSGISGRVDMDYLYTDYSSIIIPEGFLTTSKGTYYYNNYRWQKGWVTPSSGGKYFCDVSSGLVWTGWMNDGVNQYYLDPSKGGMATVGLADIDSSRYYFNADGVMQTGLLTIGEGIQTYFGADGKAVKGFVTLTDGIRYFNDDYVMLTGLQTIGGNIYYLGTNGIMQTGLVGLESGLYYFDAEGKAYTGFYTDAATGKTYYFEPTTRTALVGLQTVNGNLYYFNENAVMQTGMLGVGGLKYMFGADGAAISGFYTDPATGATYYFDPLTHAAAVGSVTINKSNYFFDAEGVMQTGFLGGYYYGVDGKMVVGQMFTDGINIYISGKDGLVLKGLTTTKDGTYMLDPTDGHMIIGFVQIGTGFFYFGEDGKMVANTTVNIAGVDCTFNKDGMLILPEGLVPPVVAAY